MSIIGVITVLLIILIVFSNQISTYAKIVGTIIVYAFYRYQSQSQIIYVNK
jgi:hypothetical protein